MNRSSMIFLQELFCKPTFPMPTPSKKTHLWAMQRVKNKGAPIKIRIVKGANLAMEQFEASLKVWPQAPYRDKIEVDANYKRMVAYGCLPMHARAANLRIASHNSVRYRLRADLARRIRRRARSETFEMLEGMADHVRRVVQKLSKEILLYCPVAAKEDFRAR